MLYWKRKPIDQLSEAELRAAIRELVPMVMERKPSNNVSDIFSAFTIGAFVGISAAALCVLIGTAF